MSGTIYAANIVLSNQPVYPYQRTALQFSYSRDTQTDLFEDISTGTGSSTWSSAGHVTLSAPISGDSIARQTYQRTASTAGLAQMAVLPLRLSSTPVPAGCIFNFGLFDATNTTTSSSGFFFQWVGSTLNCVRRTQGGSDEIFPVVPTSSLTVSPTKLEAYTVSLSLGEAILGVLRNGTNIVLHRFSLPTLGNVASTLPVRYELNNSGTAAGFSVDVSGGSLLISQDQGRCIANSHCPSALTLTGRYLSSKGVRVPVLSVRLPDCTGTYKLSDASLYSSEPVLWEVMRSGTLQGAAWTAATSDCPLVTDKTATAITVSNSALATCFTSAGAGTQFSLDAPLFCTSKGDALALTLCATGMTGKPAIVNIVARYSDA